MRRSDFALHSPVAFFGRRPNKRRRLPPGGTSAVQAPLHAQGSTPCPVPPRPLSFQPLEERQAFAADLSLQFSDGDLTLIGDGDRELAYGSSRTLSGGVRHRGAANVGQGRRKSRNR